MVYYLQVAILQKVTQNDLISWFKKNTRIDADLRLLRIQVTNSYCITIVIGIE